MHPFKIDTSYEAVGEQNHQGFSFETVTFAADQPQYNALPAVRVGTTDGAAHPEAQIVTGWRLSWKERLRILFTGRIYLSVLTFGHALQPLKPATTFKEAL